MSQDELPETMAARAAYKRAVETCDRIIRELDEQLKGSKYDGKQPTADAGADS